MVEKYPGFRYHRTKDPIIVETEQEDQALGKDWSDTPATFGIETCPELKIESEIIPEEKPSKKSK